MLKATIKRLVLWHDADTSLSVTDHAVFNVMIVGDSDINVGDEDRKLWEILKDA